MCEFTHCCVDTMFRFLKNYLFVSKKKYADDVLSLDMP